MASIPSDTGPGVAQRCLPAGLLLLLCGALFFHQLGERELSSSHEARAGQNAAAILESGRWGLPRLFDEQVELQKPPLYYWLVALSALMCGSVDAWAVRWPAAWSALGCVLLLLGAPRQWGRFTVGVAAAGILATCLHFTWLARVGRIDMPLTFAVTAALTCFHRVGNGWPWRVAGCAFVAIGILLKGPIAAALVGVVLLGMALVNARVAAEATRPTAFPRSATHRARAWSVATSAALVVVFAGPWFVWANAETGGRLWDVFVVYHNFERGFGSETLAAHPPWFYVGRFWIDAFPWSLTLPVACVLAWRRGWWRDDPLCRFGLVWFVAIFALLSLMRFKRADYLLPAYPGLALFLGAVGVRWWKEREPLLATTPRWASRRWAPYAFAGVLLGYAAGWGIYLQAHEEAWPYRTAAANIRAHAGADTPVIFFRAEVHPLAFHLRRPLGSILEWENLDIWANEPRRVYFVMPAECARDASQRPACRGLMPVFPLGDWLTAKHDRDLVVVSNRGASD